MDYPEGSLHPLKRNVRITCARCGFPGSDVHVPKCGCSFHVRCLPALAPTSHCIHCLCQTTKAIVLLPMSFNEVDEAHKLAPNVSQGVKSLGRRSRKRKNSEVMDTSQNSSQAALDISRHSVSSMHTLDTSHHSVSFLDASNHSTTGSTSFLDASNHSMTSHATERTSFRLIRDSMTEDSFDCRVGRWTTEEIAFCDRLIAAFRAGELPLSTGTKLNDFLSRMLKSKYSRLTKKMKNAKLASQTYVITTGCPSSIEGCRSFSKLEENFLSSVTDRVARAEIKFHMQKEWRAVYRHFCHTSSRDLDDQSWLVSVGEIDTRTAAARDAALSARRDLMTGYALSQDSTNAAIVRGVFIEKTGLEMKDAKENEPGGAADTPTTPHTLQPSERDEVLALLDDDNVPGVGTNGHSIPEAVDNGGPGVHRGNSMLGDSGLIHAGPFMSRILDFIRRNHLPFEHIDCWAPSCLPDKKTEANSVGIEDTHPGDDSESTYRLSFCGCATAKVQIPLSGRGPATPMNHEETFRLTAFGDYSQKFSFHAGCGLPGKVYSSGLPFWDSNVQSEFSSRQFERRGGASQWDIKSVVGIPVPSPNVGRIVVLLYSMHEREQNEDVLVKLTKACSRQMPTPKWKLIVDVGEAPVETQQSNIPSDRKKDEEKKSTTLTARELRTVDSIAGLLGEYMPSDSSLIAAGSYVSSLTNLRLFLLRSSHIPEEEDIIRTIVNSYLSYSRNARSGKDIAIMLARDFAFLQTTSIPAASASPRSSSFHVQLPQSNPRHTKLLPIQPVDTLSSCRHQLLPLTNLTKTHAPIKEHCSSLDSHKQYRVPTPITMTMEQSLSTPSSIPHHPQQTLSRQLLVSPLTNLSNQMSNCTKVDQMHLAAKSNSNRVVTSESALFSLTQDELANKKSDAPSHIPPSHQAAMSPPCDILSIVSGSDNDVTSHFEGGKDGKGIAHEIGEF